MTDIRDEIRRAAEMTDVELECLVAKGIAVIRAMALEEAAKVADEREEHYGIGIAAAIRDLILKEKQDADKA